MAGDAGAGRDGGRTLRSYLSEERRGTGSRDGGDGGRSAFESDGDRIAFDPAFRVLAGKTQVHGPAGGATARNRMSHSIEVSRVARSIGGRFAAAAPESAADPALAGDAREALQAAGLLHDLGNPLYGHTGEGHISAFFRSDPAGRAVAALAPPAHRAQFGRFDGNAQATRTALRLGGWSRDGGMRLTAATLAAACKYPWTAGHHPRKSAVFASDADAFAEVAAACGMAADGPGRWRRHPLSHLVEAADDACYLVADLEDAADMGIIGGREADALLLSLCAASAPWAAGRHAALAADGCGAARARAYLRSQAVSALAAEAAQAACASRGALMDGSLEGPLMDAAPSADAMAAVAEFSARRIYRSPGRIAGDAHAGRIIAALLGEGAARLLGSLSGGPGADGPAAGLVPDLSGAGPPEGWAHLLCDRLSGHTDLSGGGAAAALRGGREGRGRAAA